METEALGADGTLRERPKLHGSPWPNAPREPKNPDLLLALCASSNLVRS